ncbi:MFS transporter [Streptomyces sulfonofaciens]|uniref:MFS transporter n=1 Tax=Streptomyces sulfonofaciens TaxID=68272 RepID=A0A919KVB1_9ACTN|nr:MFS transporter [Streptomyces sulfonofaciens]
MWAAAVLSRFGDALRTSALPLLAASLTDRPLLVAAVTACGYLPWIIFGLWGGALADRVDQRRAMWSVDVGRGLMVAAFALAVALGRGGIGLLIVLAFALTTLQTLFDNASTALLPRVVPHEALGPANGRLMTGQRIAGGLLALPLVPLLLAAGAATPYAVDALTFLAAAALVASLRTPPPEGSPRPPGRTLRADIAEGLRALWQDRPLRGLCTATALCNVGMGAVIATLVLLATGWLGADDTQYVTAMTAYAVGSLVGGALASRLAARLGRMRSVCVAGIAQTAALAAIGTVRSLVVLTAGLAVFGLMGMVWNINQATLMQQRSPARLLGRVSSAFRTVAISGAPLGALLGGAFATAWGLNTPALLAAGLFAAAVLALWPAVRTGTPARSLT